MHNRASWSQAPSFAYPQADLKRNSGLDFVNRCDIDNITFGRKFELFALLAFYDLITSWHSMHGEGGAVFLASELIVVWG